MSGLLESSHVASPSFKTRLTRTKEFIPDRPEKWFGDNQVWAAYDGDDGMSRYYVHKVTFRIRWLISKINSELDPLTWGSSGLSKTSVDFPVGKYEVRISVNNTMSSYLSFFTHDIILLNWNISLIVYKLYVSCSHRGKGEVWALFRIWSLD